MQALWWNEEDPSSQPTKDGMNECKITFEEVPDLLNSSGNISFEVVVDGTANVGDAAPKTPSGLFGPLWISLEIKAVCLALSLDLVSRRCRGSISILIGPSWPLVFFNWGHNFQNYFFLFPAPKAGIVFHKSLRKKWWPLMQQAPVLAWDRKACVLYPPFPTDHPCIWPPPRCVWPPLVRGCMWLKRGVFLGFFLAPGQKCKNHVFGFFLL